jgi:hypothetical protein
MATPRDLVNKPQRAAQDAQKLLECYPVLHARPEMALVDIEAAGYRPRIHEAWHSPADQQREYDTNSYIIPADHQLLQSYLDTSHRVVSQQLTKAGVRLAQLLNETLQ